MILLLLLFQSLICVSSQQLAEKLPLPSSTYNLAQVVASLSDSIFVVGRRDGTITLFKTPSNSEHGPIVTQALITPSSSAVEMISIINTELLVTSNDISSMAVWSAMVQGIKLYKLFEFDKKMGVMNSGASIDINGISYFVAGHSNGYVSIWLRNGRDFLLYKIIDAKSSSPPSNPFDLHNIRAVIPYSRGRVLLGSEDGDVSILDVATGKFLLRRRYNEYAKRGINSMSFDGKYLAIANCAVGYNDKNLWLYEVDGNSIRYIDSIYLAENYQSDSVHNFNIKLFKRNNTSFFFSSTGDGLLWLGRIEGGKLIISDKSKISKEGGAALDIDRGRNNMIAVSQALLIFRLR